MTHSAVPAMDLDAERAALGAVLLGGIPVFRALGLSPVTFYTESHRAIHRAMRRLVDRGESPDHITVAAELARVDDLELAGGPAQIALLLEQGATAVYATSYARIIAEHAQRREYDALAERLANANGAGLAARAAMLREAETRIRELAPLAPATVPTEAAQFLAHRFPVRQDLIAQGVLPRAGLLLFNGPPKVRKSMLCDNLMLQRTRGAPWLGFATDPGITLAIQAEHSPESWQRRIAAMTAYDPEPLPTGQLFLRTLRGCAINTADGLATLHRLLDETGADLLRIDPLARYMRGRENSNDEDGMGGVVRAIDTILERGCAVVLVHHQGKPGKDDPRTGGMTLRGGSALYAAADNILTVERDGPDAVILSFELRDARPLPPMRLTVTPDLWLTTTGADPELVAIAKLTEPMRLPYKTLIGAVQQDLSLSESTAKRRLNAAIKAGLLEKDVDGLYGPGSRVQQDSADV